MKLAFFTDSYLPNVDGVVSSILTFRNELESRGHDVYVFSAGDKKIEDDHAFFYRSVPFPPYPQYKIALFPYTAKKQVKTLKAELVHSHAIASMGLPAVKTAKDLKLPLVGTFHTMVPKAMSYVTTKKWSNDLAAKFAWRAVKEFYKPFDLVTTPSHVIKTMLEDEGISTPIVSVPNGLELKRFNPDLDPALIRTLLNIPKEKKIFLVAGRMSKEKNVEVVIRAAKRVLKENDDAFFIISGDGPTAKEYKHLAHAEGLDHSMLFTGFVPPYVLPYLYAGADAMVTASTFETQGLCVLEQMACARPVVAASALAIPEVVTDGTNGYLFEPFNEEECADKMLKLLDLPRTQRDKMRANARKTAEEFSIEKCTDQLLRAYSQVL